MGAFKFEGVREGIEKTKALIEEKLQAYEAFKGKELGLASAQAQTASGAKSELLAQSAKLLTVE